MRVTKSRVPEEDTRLALDILNRLRSGVRVFGDPAEGLKKTLSKLESEKPEEDSFDSIDYHLSDSDYAGQVARLKKGIEGEKKLSEYLEKIIRLDIALSDMIVFASLGDEDSGKDYIPDTDFVCVYGKRILCLDAKNINTKPQIPIFVSGNALYTALDHNTPLLEVNPSTHVWRATLDRENPGHCSEISGCTCIINKTGAEIFRDQDWYRSDIKPVHISELVDFLHEWCEGADPAVDLQTLVTLAKRQIKEGDSTIDLTYGKRVFGV